MPKTFEKGFRIYGTGLAPFYWGRKVCIHYLTVRTTPHSDLTANRSKLQITYTGQTDLPPRSRLGSLPKAWALLALGQEPYVHVSIRFLLGFGVIIVVVQLWGRYMSIQYLDSWVR